MRNQGVVERADQVRVLASPARQEIVDTLEALGGEAPVAVLAAHLGRPSDGLYYHLRLLVLAGILEELDDQGEGRRYRTTTNAGTRLRLRYHPGKTENARAVGRVAAGMLRSASRDFAAAIGDPHVVVEGRARALWASRSKGWVGAAELVEINRLLKRLNTLLQRGPATRRGQLVSLTWVLVPVTAKPSRRA